MKRTYLTERQILDMITELKTALCIDYMPTKSEMLTFYKNTTLANAVTKKGGHKYFANLLGLKLKKSCSQMGDASEEFIKEVLEKQGYDVKRTPPRHPYDLLVENLVRVDVKSANPMLSRVEMKKQYVYSINNEFPKCDVFIFVKKDKKEIYVIPSNFIRQSQLGIGETSKYDIYKNRFDYINVFIDLHKKVVTN